MAPLKGAIVAIAAIALLIEGVVIWTMGDFSPARPTKSSSTEIRPAIRVSTEERDPSVADPSHAPPVPYLVNVERSDEGVLVPGEERSGKAPSIPQIGLEPDGASELDKRAASEAVPTSGGERTTPQSSSEVLASSAPRGAEGLGNDVVVGRPPLVSLSDATQGEVSERPIASPEAEEQVEDRQHAERESMAQQATVDYYLGADAGRDGGPGISQQTPAAAIEAAADQPGSLSIDGKAQAEAALIPGQASDKTVAASLVEDRLHAARERLAERYNGAEAAAVDQARLARIETDRQASIALAQDQARVASAAKIEADAENRLHAARESLAEQKTVADAAAERARLAQIETDRQTLIAAQKRAQGSEKLAVAKDEAGAEDRLHAARERMAEEKSVADAAAERARLAQIETERQASIVLAQEKESLRAAKIEADVENRLHAARERVAEEKSVADAAAERLRLAQIETDRQALIAAQKKQAQEKEGLRAAKIEADVENRLHAARERVAEEQSVADAAAERARLAQIETDRQASIVLAQRKAAQEKDRLASVARIESGVENQLHAARQRLAMQKTAADAVAERVRLAQVETDRLASIAVARKQAQENERLASIARTEATVEGRLHAAREAAAEQTTTDIEIGKRAGATRSAEEYQKAVKSSANVVTLQSAAPSLSPSSASQPTSTGSIDSSTATKGVQKSPPLGKGEIADINRRTAAKESELASNPHRSSLGSLNGARRRPAFSRVALAEAGVASSINGPEDVRVFQRRCPSILDSSSEYDEDLVTMCRGWAAKR